MPPLASRTPRITVVGSVNLDLRVAVEELPAPGATVLGTGVSTGPGGKGANQAAAAARLGGSVRFIGRVGSDDAGVRLRAALAAAGVATEGLGVVDGPSGLAIIEVEASGQNRIVVVQGANLAVTPEVVSAADLNASDVLVLQLEIPLATVRHAARLGREAGALVLLNAAPDTRLTAADLHDVDLLVVNELEADALLGTAGLAVSTASPPGRAAAPDTGAAIAPDTGAAAAPDTGAAAADLACTALLALVPAAVVTLGARGAAWAERGEGVWPVRHASLRQGTVAAYEVTPVDTTGAGDTFVGALAVRLGAGDDLPTAVRYACAAAALATTRPGALEAVPTAAEVDALVRARRSDDGG